MKYDSHMIDSYDSDVDSLGKCKLKLEIFNLKFYICKIKWHFYCVIYSS